MRFTGKLGLAGTLTALVLASATGVLAKSDRTGAAFQNMDTNGDGFVTEAEFDAAAAARFDAGDTNGDNTLDRDEMIMRAQDRVAAAGRSVSADRIEARVSKMMERADTNGDGVLQRSELSGPSFAEILDRADANGDGQLSEAEFADLPRDRGGFGSKRG
ncbi:MAG: hypothetical protein AAGJ34_08250 [Pseudomonadota bacterium]